MKTIYMGRILSAALLIVFALMPTFVSAFNPDSGVNTHAGITTGWYDHQQIWYDNSAGIIHNPQAAAQLIKKGTVVYHVVDSDGNIPPQQIAFPVPPTGGVVTDGNVLSAIPTEMVYTGGAWNLQIFHWNATATIRALTKDDDILAAAAGGEGKLEITDIIVRCPVIDFSNLR